MFVVGGVVVHGGVLVPGWWRRRSVTHVMNAFWSSLFVHRDAVYLFGTSQQYGSIVIRRSDDGGFCWTHPEDAASGLLFPGGAHRTPPNSHCAPVAVPAPTSPCPTWSRTRTG